MFSGDKRLQAPILLESRVFTSDNAWVSGFGTRCIRCFGRFFVVENAIGERERERRALSGEAFRGSPRFSAWFQAPLASKGEGFREFRARFRSERVVGDGQIIKGEGIRELGLSSADWPEMSRIGQR